LTDNLFIKGAYWYTGGINWIAMVCWAIGAALFGLGKSLGIGGALPSLIIAGIIYLIAMNIFKKDLYIRGSLNDLKWYGHLELCGF